MRPLGRLHILDRFHIVAKMNKALDEVRVEETRTLGARGRRIFSRRSAFVPVPQFLPTVV